MTMTELWPESELHLFGSSGNSLGNASSDLDVCLCVDWGKQDSSEEARDLEVEAVEKAAAALRADVRWSEIEAVSTARIPIVKLRDADSQTEVDLGFNNPMAIHNTALIKTYMESNPVARQVVVAVRKWSKARGVCDPTNGTLTSYAWALLAIAALQTSTPAALPCLHSLQCGKTMCDDPRAGKQWDVSFCRDCEAAAATLEPDQCCASQLLAHFFANTRYLLGLCSSVSSVRVGGSLPRQEKSTSPVAKNAARKSVL